MRSPCFLEYIKEMNLKNNAGKGRRVHSELGPCDFDLYIYEWMTRHHIMGEVAITALPILPLSNTRIGRRSRIRS